MGIVVNVAGTDRTSQSYFQSIDISNTISAKADVATLSFLTTGGWHPQAANTISIESATTEFAGVIMEVKEVQVNPSQFRYECDCRDFVYLLDRSLVVDSFPTQAGSNVVASIIGSYTSGFSTGGIQASGTVSAKTYDYVNVSDCIQDMADELGWAWNVGYDKSVNFFDPATQMAPVATIDIDSNTTDYGNLTLSESVHQVKNSIFLKGFPIKSTNTYNSQFAGDGTTKFFFLGYEPGSTAPADISITRSGAAQTINLDTIDGTPDTPVGTANDVFVCYDNMGIRWDTAPSSTDVIVATYTVMSQLPINVQDTASQSTMAAREGGTGIHEYVVNDPGLKANDGTDSLAQARGSQLLRRFAYPRFQARFSSFRQGWKAGQTVALTSTKRFGGFTRTMYVQSVRKRLVNHPVSGTPTFRYDIDLSDSALAI